MYANFQNSDDTDLYSHQKKKFSYAAIGLSAVDEVHFPSHW